MESSVFDGEGSLDRVISDKEVEDEHAVQDWEDFPGEKKLGPLSYLNMKAPAIDVNLQYLLQIVALGLWFRLVGTTFHLNHKFVLFTLKCSSYICISLTRKK